MDERWSNTLGSAAPLSLDVLREVYRRTWMCEMCGRRIGEGEKALGHGDWSVRHVVCPEGAV